MRQKKAPVRSQGRIILVLIVFIMFTLALSGCGAGLQVDTSVDERGAGTRILCINVSHSDLEQVNGGEPALTEALKAAMPEVLTMSSATDEYGVHYTFTMKFKSIDELTEKSARILGFQPEIRFTKQGSPFAREYLLEENTDANAYFQWAIDAAKPLVSSENQSSMVESVSNRVFLPGATDFCTTSTTDWSASSTKTNPVKGIEIETVVSENSPQRTVTIIVDQKTVKSIDRDEKNLIQKFLKEKSKGAKLTTKEQKGTVRYSFTLEGNSPDELARTSNAVFGTGTFKYEPVGQKSFFRVYNRYYFVDSYDLQSWLGVSPQETVKYTARFKGPMVDALGAEVNGGTREMKMDIPGGYLRAETYVKEMSWFGVASLAVLALTGVGVVVVLILLYRKNREQVNSYVLGVFAKLSGSKGHNTCPACRNVLNPGEKYCSKCGAATGARCMQCGFPSKPGDKFCYSCGARLEEAIEPDGSAVAQETEALIAAAEDSSEDQKSMEQPRSSDIEDGS